MKRLVQTSYRSLIPALVIYVWVAAASAAGPPSASATDESCRRIARTPERIAYNDDSRPDEIHAAGGAMYCPSGVWVQITACVQRQTDDGWTDVGCVTSPRTRITPQTPGGRGQAVSFEVPCVTGVVRTHVTGGEGLEPTEWDSDSATITCFVDDDVDTPPETSILSGPSGPTEDHSPSFAFSASKAGSTFECRLDDGPWTPCTSPAVYPSLTDGDHRFQVRASDAAGHTDTSPATRSFTIYTSQPPPTEPGPGSGGGTGSGGGGAGGGGGDPVSEPSKPGRATDRTGPTVVIPRSNRAIRAGRAGTVRFTIGPLDESAAGVLSLALHGRKLGTRSFTVGAGQTVAVRVRLTRRGRALLGDRGRLRVRATIVVRDAAGNATVTHFRFALRPPG